MAREARITALRALDEAIEIVRFQPLSTLVRCTLPSLAITWLLLLAYYFERVEGSHALRPLFALGLVAAWCARALVLGRFAQRCAHGHRGQPDALPDVTPRALLGAAALLGVELWLWLWLLVFALRTEPWLSLALLPALSLRGALAPSWLAACASLPNAGVLRATHRAWAAAKEQRTTGIGCELFLLLGSTALFFNIGALLAAVLSFSQELLGLEVSFVRAFISPRNHFVMLALAGVSLSALDPLRAALAGVLCAESRLRDETAAVRALIQRCVQGEALKASVILLASLCCVSIASAQEPATAEAATASAEAEQEECDEACNQARARDDVIETELVDLLTRDEFREFPSEPWAFEQDASTLLDRLWRKLIEWLSGSDQPVRPRNRATKIELPSTRGVLIGASVLLAVAVLFAWLAKLFRKRQPTSASASTDQPEELGTLSEQLQEALRLAERDPTAALRMLYLVSLRALAQRGLLTLRQDATNAQYVRAVTAEPARQHLAELTRCFDRSHYGALPPDQRELALAKQLARDLVQTAGAP